MPQMMPMNWVFLFVLFLTSYMFLLAELFFFGHFSTPTLTTTLKPLMAFWTW